MSADHDYSGDYGYDLLDEVRAALQLPSPRGSVLPVHGGRVPRRELYSNGDYGYDQAHEL
ncbi:hypothetical protein [Pseudonocardia acidicola]|uniref:Uncharacterized protein n=1 Tax=Pseudonocardia acidicola TaxID=2724939 RepID=A0ABX1SF48_9PSEU|nr:hypothetical protein [Pseudonocardia acidicola]NMH99527.1 hypothetical protein [Pseudonocardia acidicola]